MVLIVRNVMVLIVRPCLILQAWVAQVNQKTRVNTRLQVLHCEFSNWVVLRDWYVCPCSH